MPPWKSLFIGVLLVGAVAGVAVAQSGYELTVDDSEEVPERTVTIEGEEYRIDAIGQVTPGEDLRVTVDAPDEESTYRLRLYDSDMNQLQTRKRTGDETVTFVTDCQDCDPGTYMVGLYEDGELLVVHPAVIAGYDVTLEMPDSAEEGETVEATITVEEGALSGQPHTVELALGNGGGEERRMEATHESGTTYTTSVDLEGLDPGSYHVYAGALSDETVADSDKREALAISSSHTLEVTTTDDSDDGDGDSGGDGTDDEQYSSGGETSETSTPTQTVTPTETPDGENGTATDTSTPTTMADVTETPTATAAENVITPNGNTETPTQSDGPGPSLPLVVAICAAVGLWLRRRSR